MNEATMAVAVRGSADEVDVQITTAKRYPRDVDTALAATKGIILSSEDCAESCIFGLPRGDKTIEGPSIRFAEILCSAWGNSRVAATIVERADRYVVAQGRYFDLERNVMIVREVRRPTVDRNGRPFSDDLKTMAENAAGAIAIRNAILMGIPQGVWAPLFEAARSKVAGEASKLTDRRAAALELLGKMGVTQGMVLAAIGVKAIGEITQNHLVTLKAVIRMIRSGEVDLDDAFPSETAPEAKAGKGVEGLKGKMAKARKADEAPEAVENAGEGDGAGGRSVFDPEPPQTAA